MDNENFSGKELQDENETETSFSVSAAPNSSHEDYSAATQTTLADVKLKEKMDNQLEHGQDSDNIAHDEDKPETSVTASSSSHQNDSTTGQGTAVRLKRGACFVPFCGLVFCVMASLGLTCSFALRFSLNVAIVAMVNHTALSDHVNTTNATNSSGTDECPRDLELQHADGEFTWDRHEQAAALATFYYGHIITQIPGGWLADRFGGRWPFGVSVLVSSVISLLTPAAARIHLGVLMLLRVLSGLSAGFLFPAVHALIARWSAPRNRSLVVAVILVGTDVGVVVGMMLSGVLCDHGFAGGWPSVFYVFSMIGCLWSGAWFLLVYDSPATHPRISKAELEYWEKEIGATEMVTRPPTPWLKILTSVPVWALAIAFFASDWGFYTIAVGIPLFMHDVLGFNMTKNGVLSALPFLAAGLIIPIGWFADWLRSPGRMSTNFVRKVFCATGFILPACFTVLAGYTGCNRVPVVVFMFLAIGSLIMSFIVVTTNQLDLAPMHAGKIMGLTYFVAGLASVAVPHVVGALTYHSSTHAEWQRVFFLAAGVYAVGTIVFVVFGSGNRQSWADTAGEHTVET